MSLDKWGTFLVSVDSEPDAKEIVRRCNVALAEMPLTHQEKMAIEFHYVDMYPMRMKRIYYIYAKNLPGKYHGIRAVLRS